MKELTTYVLHYFSLILGISISEVETILSIICLLFSISMALLTIILKLKTYLQDGKLDKEELEDLTGDIKKIQDKIEEGKRNGRN